VLHYHYDVGTESMGIRLWGINQGIGSDSLGDEVRKTCRYGFNGKEKDDEVYGEGNEVDFGIRGYDSRLGRWMSVDPSQHKLTNWSSYSFSRCNPILYFDPDGAFPYTFFVRAFAPPNAFSGTGFHDDQRGFSANTDPNTTSRIKQSFTIDPTAKTFSGGQPTSDPTIWFGGASKTAKDKGGISTPEFGKNSLGSPTAAVTSNFEGSNPFFYGSAPNIEVSSAISITENTKKGMLFVSIDLSSKQFPATEGVIQDNAGNNVFLAGAAAFGGAQNLVGADKKPAAKMDLIININDKGVFQSVSVGNKTYTLKEFNKIATSKKAGPLPREDKDKK
jgi:RHS repeat-associated protein